MPELIETGKASFKHVSFPIPDFVVPDNREAFRTFVSDAARRLEAGTFGLLHCGA
jgi:hypothetical protein